MTNAPGLQAKRDVLVDAIAAELERRVEETGSYVDAAAIAVDALAELYGSRWDGVVAFAPTGRSVAAVPDSPAARTG